MDTQRKEMLENAGKEVTKHLDRMYRKGGSKNTVSSIATYLGERLRKAANNELPPEEMRDLFVEIRLMILKAGIPLDAQALEEVLCVNPEERERLRLEQEKRTADARLLEETKREEVLRLQAKQKQAAELLRNIQEAFGMRFIHPDTAMKTFRHVEAPPLPSLDLEKLKQMPGIGQFLLAPSLPVNIRTLVRNDEVARKIVEPTELREILGKDACMRGEHTFTIPPAVWYFFCAFATGEGQQHSLGTWCTAEEMIIHGYDFTKLPLRPPHAALAVQAQLLHRQIFNRWIGDEGLPASIECLERDEEGQGIFSPVRQHPLAVPVIVRPLEQKLFIGTGDVFADLESKLLLETKHGDSKNGPQEKKSVFARVRNVFFHD